MKSYGSRMGLLEDLLRMHDRLCVEDIDSRMGLEPLDEGLRLVINASFCAPKNPYDTIMWQKTPYKLSKEP